ncbi:MAG: hypothetical protein N2253_03735 [Bacteroidia bacterium]|nr:hypothetical protein [Bacteroidia bacterium]
MHRVLRSASIAGVLIAFISCRGKQGPEGPQGPPGPAGQNYVRPQNGFIEGVAIGKDQSGTPFRIPFRYTYYAGSPGQALRRGADTLNIEFSREDSLGIGNLSFSFTLRRSTLQASSINMTGTAADISTSPVPTFRIQVVPPLPPASYPGTSQTISNIQLRGDTLITGEFRFIRPSYTPPPIPVPGIDFSAIANAHPDTVTGRFEVRLVPIISYGRMR